MALFRKTLTQFDLADVVTVIGPEAYFHGMMTVRGSIRIEGEVEGDVTEAHMVVVGPSGRIRGNISADSVVVGGQIRGDIVASAALEIKAGGRVGGNIRSPKLLIEDGAVFEGQCVMSAGQPKDGGAADRDAEPARE